MACADRREFMARVVQTFGPAILEKRRAAPRLSGTVNLGACSDGLFDEHGYSEQLGLTFEQVNRICDTANSAQSGGIDQALGG